MQGSVSNVRIAGRVLGLGTADTIVHHVHAFTIHVTALILLLAGAASLYLFVGPACTYVDAAFYAPLHRVRCPWMSDP